MDGAARKLTETVAPAPATQTAPLAPPSAPPPMPARLTIGLVRRWLALHRGELRALAIGAPVFHLRQAHSARQVSARVRDH